VETEYMIWSADCLAYE